jgi:O-antigen/teichoic acid export membrane protein
MSRSRRSAATLATGLLATAVTVLVGMVCTPLLLRWLGRERYGAFRAASDWYTNLTLLETGLTAALAALMAGALARRDRSAVVGLVKAGVRAYLGLAVVYGLLMAGLAVLMPRLVHVEGELASELRLGCWIAVLGVLALPLSPLRPLAEASQRGAIVNLLFLTQCLLVTGLSLGFAWAGWGITGQFVATAAGAFVLPVALALESLSRWPELWRGWRAARAANPRTLWGLNWPNFLLTLCGRVSLTSDAILVALILGAGSVVPFTLTQKLIAVAGGQALLIGSSTWAALSELFAQGKLDRFRERLYDLTSLTSMAGVALVLPTAIFNRAFVALWVGADNYAGDGLSANVAVNVWAQGLFALWGWVFTATGRVRGLLPCLLTSTAVNLLVSVLATTWHGLGGPLLGTLSAYGLVQVWWFPRLLKRDFGLQGRRLMASALWPLVAAAPAGVAVVTLAAAFPPDGWLTLFAGLAVAELLVIAALWLWAVPRGLRGELAGQARRAIDAIAVRFYVAKSRV